MTAPPLCLDHNARAPLAAPARDAMVAALELGGNPSSPHSAGQAARAAVEEARAQVAHMLGAKDRDVTFTSGATEALHHALHGFLAATGKRVLVACRTEHHAVVDELERLHAQGTAVARFVDVEADGSVDEERWRAALGPDVAAAVLMVANNETGVIHNVRKLAKRVREDCGALTLLDAAQVPGRLELEAPSMAGDALVLSACKFGGPPGVGALWMPHATEKRWRPPRAGGAQERGHRPGTENLLGIVGMGAAAATVGLTEVARVTALRDALELGVRARFPDAVVHGVGAPRLGNTCFVGFPGVDVQMLLLLLDEKGIQASSGSACVSGSMKPSHVLLAMGVPPALARASVRFSFGPSNGALDVERLLLALEDVVVRARLKTA